MLYTKGKQQRRCHVLSVLNNAINTDTKESKPVFSCYPTSFSCQDPRAQLQALQTGLKQRERKQSRPQRSPYLSNQKPEGTNHQLAQFMLGRNGGLRAAKSLGSFTQLEHHNSHSAGKSKRLTVVFSHKLQHSNGAKERLIPSETFKTSHGTRSLMLVS